MLWFVRSELSSDSRVFPASPFGVDARLAPAFSLFYLPIVLVLTLGVQIIIHLIYAVAPWLSAVHSSPEFGFSAFGKHLRSTFFPLCVCVCGWSTIQISSICYVSCINSSCALHWWRKGWRSIFFCSALFCSVCAHFWRGARRLCTLKSSLVLFFLRSARFRTFLA